jgi:hypothetical protein
MNTRRQLVFALLFAAMMPAFAAEPVTATVYYNPS